MLSYGWYRFYGLILHAPKLHFRKAVLTYFSKRLYENIYLTTSWFIPNSYESILKFRQVLCVTRSRSERHNTTKLHKWLVCMSMFQVEKTRSQSHVIYRFSSCSKLYTTFFHLLLWPSALSITKGQATNADHAHR